MSVQRVVLGIASVALPHRHRARWREEASAVLMEVSGPRRVWYTVDTVLKVPILARQHRRGRAGRLPDQGTSTVGRAIAATVGAALLASALALIVPIVLVAPRRAPGDPLPVLAVLDLQGYALVLGGLFAVVAARSFRSVRRRGGGLRYADSGAVLVTVFAGTGPVVAGPVSVALDLPAVTLVGNGLPGVWLAVICAMALGRGTGPRPLAAVGTVAGLALIGVLGSVPLGHFMPGHQPLVAAVGALSTAVAVPTYLIWSGWAGVRLLLGRQDLLVAPKPRCGATLLAKLGARPI